MVPAYLSAEIPREDIICQGQLNGPADDGSTGLAGHIDIGTEAKIDVPDGVSDRGRDRSGTAVVCSEMQHLYGTCALLSKDDAQHSARHGNVLPVDDHLHRRCLKTQPVVKRHT